ncbi:MAG: glycosyltransferase family 9 protein [Gemmatimonadota bacterium]
MLDGQRVAIVLLSAIGDIVHALPLVASLKAAAPRARIEWVTQPAPARLAAHHPGIDRVWTLDRKRGWRGFRALRRELAGERFDLVIDLQVYAKASLVTAWLDSPRKLGFDRARARELNWLVTTERLPARPVALMVDQYLEFADYLGAPRRYEWALPLTAAERAAQAAFFGARTRPVAALVVGTSRPDKEWPVTSVARLAEALHADWGYAVCLVGGDHPAERARARLITELVRTPLADERREDLRKLLWLLDGAALAVSPDTGPYHLAVALGVPTIGLYGTADPARIGPSHRCLELLLDAFHAPGEPWHPPRSGYRPGRISTISPERVLETVGLARARYPRAVQGPAGGGSPA